MLIEDEKMMDMFNDLEVKGYRVFKTCSITKDSDSGRKLYRASIRIPSIGEFTVHSRDKVRDAIRGAALKLKFHLKDEAIGDYDLRPNPVMFSFRGDTFGSKDGKFVFV